MSWLDDHDTRPVSNFQWGDPEAALEQWIRLYRETHTGRLSRRNPREQRIPKAKQFEMPCEFCDDVHYSHYEVMVHHESHFLDGRQLRLWPQ